VHGRQLLVTEDPAAVLSVPELVDVAVAEVLARLDRLAGPSISSWTM